eukprot:TRINITY_DN61925_c0_g1_i1.p2 TRINITY_DN61925_c0_g1~~TRINITY_DN61925_c0_g1_i1.p2  ORF type:complete len:110 (-),score=38.67 TRINITY_DN61925_c0_g1_i1:104-433(-)
MALKTVAKLKGLSQEQVEMIQSITEQADVIMSMHMTSLEINWNWRTIAAVMNAYVHNTPHEITSIPAATAAEDSLSVLGENLLTAEERVVLSSQDLACLLYTSPSPRDS